MNEPPPQTHHDDPLSVAIRISGIIALTLFLMANVSSSVVFWRILGGIAVLICVILVLASNRRNKRKAPPPATETVPTDDQAMSGNG